MKDKCNFCNYSDINKINFYDYIVDSCNSCDYIKLTISDYLNLIDAYLYTTNYKGIRKYYSIDQCPTHLQKKIIKFVQYFKLENFNKDKKSDASKQCNVCGDKLTLFKNCKYKKFKIYVCNYCKLIYLNKKSFIDFINFITKDIEKKSKWYGFIYYILEIFQ